MNIAVLTGGASVERDVAIASAAQTVDALRSRGHSVAVIDIATGSIDASHESEYLAVKPGVDPPALDCLQPLERQMLLGGLGRIPAVDDADVVCLALHGGQGEDGTVQAVLDVLGLPYTGSGHLASALAMDKDLSKQLFERADLTVPRWLMGRPPATAVEHLGWPLVVKPSKQGSTVGLSLVPDGSGLPAAYELAAQYDNEIMVEEFIPGRELTVAVLGNEALPVGEIIPKHDIFDYECKYTPGMAQEIFPADLDANLALSLQEAALLAHRSLKLGGYSRIDFRLGPTGAIFCLEANTLPGMTATSLVPQAARAAGIEFAVLCERICELALE